MTTATLDPAQVSVAPSRSLEQRRAGLRRANEIRCYRAELKRGLKRTPRQLALREVALQIVEPDELLHTMKVAELLMACPSVGASRVRQVLVRGRISPSKTIGGLAPSQRQWLALAISQLAGRREIGSR